MYQSILFDLDGTLTDPKAGICTSVQYALEDAGITEPSLDALEPFIGPPLADSFREFYQMSDAQIERAILKYRERFETVGLYENEIYEGIADMLKALKESGRKLGIASSKPTVFVEKILDYFHILSYFDVVVGAELDGRRNRKEEVVEEALRQLFLLENKNYDTCVMVGDRKFDIQGAKEHGIDSIGVCYGYGGREELELAGADYTVDTVAELQKLLLEGEGDTPLKVPEKPEKQAIMEKVSQNSFLKTWNILFPVLFYWAVCNIFLMAGVFLVQLILGRDTNVAELLGEAGTSTLSVLLNAAAMFLSIPFMYTQYKKDCGKKEKRIKQFGSHTGLLYGLLGIFGVSSALFFNMLLSYIEFDSLSPAYRQVSNAQYSVSFLAGLVIYGVISPAAEELVFRGLVLKRLQRYFKSSIAIGVSAFIFGMYHGNVVQGVYAFLLGCAIGVCFLWFDSLLVPIIIHAAANIGIFAITYHRSLERIVNHPMNCVIFLIISLLTLFQLRKYSFSVKNEGKDK